MIALDNVLLFQIFFLLQGFVLVTDEILFHYRREVPLWERIGHPLDTLSVLITFIVLYTMPGNLLLFVGFAIFSCLFVTKDEWIHHAHCSAKEQWLHSVLFILHPIVFYFAYKGVSLGTKEILLPPMAILSLFLTYQIVYWNYYERGKSGQRFSADQ